ncbi:Tm-1-like ATP-binding domain-containing protein [Nocardiopsis rhodophaea]|uniref:Tm-1-like ATP-binding domain-containing protein n=1 Tax=Nocardiopsis rhodophaea TaxID=280238 RepID=A0ABN2SV42_9ACTN
MSGRDGRAVAVLGTLDTKAAECGYVRDRLLHAGLRPVVVDCGVYEPDASCSVAPDVPRTEVARAAGHDTAALARAGNRGAAVTAMAEGARATVLRLRAEGRLDAALAVGGTGGTSIAAHALRALPLGVPKVAVSTAASGDTRPYVAESDLVLMPSVVDVAGLNSVSARILANACGAVAGMMAAPPPEYRAAGPAVAASMFGVTTPAVTRARRLLEERGREVLVFHMTGIGGRTLESLVDQGALNGVLDLTTTELADELAGGVMSAGPTRLTCGGPGTPRVVSVGALDMVNFGAADTVPERFGGRLLHVHNPAVTLMRTCAEECAQLGARLAERVAALEAPAAVVLPLRGISALSVDGGPFHAPAADAELFAAVRAGLEGTGVRLVELDTEINDPKFADTAVGLLDDLMRASAHTKGD